GDACSVTLPELSGANAPLVKRCGQTLPQIYTSINSNIIPYVTGYRFRVTNMTNPEGPYAVQVIERSESWFSFTMLESYEYDTTYGIEVAVQVNGEFSSYGVSCNVMTPSLASFNLKIKQCGVTYTSVSSLISAYIIPNVTTYRFRV